MLKEIFGFVEEEFPCKIVEIENKRGTSVEVYIEFEIKNFTLASAELLPPGDVCIIYDHGIYDNTITTNTFDLNDPSSIDEISELVRGILNEWHIKLRQIKLLS